MPVGPQCQRVNARTGTVEDRHAAAGYGPETGPERKDQSLGANPGTASVHSSGHQEKYKKVARIVDSACPFPVTQA